jgi:hypothetical protein
MHLASGLHKVEERLSQMKEIYEKGFLCNPETKLKECIIENHNIVFLVGDLNFRIPIENANCRNLIEQNFLSEIICEDQLIKLLKTHPLVSKFREAAITFAPTYKYNKKSNDYDTSKKKRIPAYCDRIIYSDSRNNLKENFINCRCYNRAEITNSDHKPVYAIYEIIIETIEEDKKFDLEEEIYSTYLKKSTSIILKFFIFPS